MKNKVNTSKVSMDYHTCLAVISSSNLTYEAKNVRITKKLLDII